MYAEFDVPVKEASGLTTGQWIWDLGAWPGVKSASLDGFFGTLAVEAAPRAMLRVRRFCKRRGYTERKESP